MGKNVDKQNSAINLEEHRKQMASWHIEYNFINNYIKCKWFKDPD